MAGTRDHPFEDLSNWMQLGKIPQTFLMNGHDFKASWINTIGDQGKLPYMRTPALLECCLSDRSHPASFFKLDLFHVCCAGILKDFVGSCLTVLLELFDEPNLPERAVKMNEVLKTFCKNQRHTFHANQLNLTLLGYSVKDYVSGSWSKGQDSIVLLRFVVWLCGNYPANDIEQHDLIKVAAEVFCRFWDLLHASGVWIYGQDAMDCMVKGQAFCTAYQRLAVWAFDSERFLFNMVPKCHCFHHVVVVMRMQLLAHGVVWNPLNDSTPQDEDFVGHTARVTRRVSGRATALRTLQRWKLGVLPALQSNAASNKELC